MIPLWLTPKVIKGSILGIIIMSIFFAGFYTRGKLSAAKIVRLKTEIATLDSNYDLCYENLQRSNANWLELKDIVKQANLEVTRMNEEYNLKVVQLREVNRAAISHLNASHEEAMTDMLAEANELREAMASMSQSEACHHAILEIVK